MKHQRGLTLLEMILVIGLMAVATLMSFYEKQSSLEQSSAKRVGAELFTYNNAVRAWISANPGAAGAVHQGSAWLKLTTCGGSSTIAYLDCSFSPATVASNLSFGRLSLTSTVETSGVSPNQRTVVTTQSSPLMVGGTTRSDLSGLAAIVAAAGSTGSTTPVLMATDGKYTSAPASGIITMVASSNPTSDAWLRTDGSNTMNSNITFKAANAANLRQLLNVSRIQALASEVFYIGQSGGALTSHSVVVDANEALLGNLQITNQAGVATALGITRGNIEVQNGYVNAGIFYDADNTTYRVDPSSMSVLNNITANGSLAVAGSAQINNNLTVYGTSYVAGAGTVNGRLTTNEYLNLAGAASQGAGCSPIGLVGRTTDGKLLSCVNGVWTGTKPTFVRGPISYSPASTFNAYTVSTCPANATLMFCEQRTASQYGRFPTDYEVDYGYSFEVNDENETTSNDQSTTDIPNNQCLAYTRSYDQSDGTMAHRSRVQAVCAE